MKLGTRQREYLTAISEKPALQPWDQPAWWERLWLKGFIDVIGRSVYITEAGRQALSKKEG